MLQRLQALPGVQHATFATIPPLSSNEDGKPISIPGVTFASPDDGVLQVNTVGPDFFETFGVRILKGRGITASDSQSAPQVAVVSESMARYYFPGIDPIGRRMDVGRGRTGGQIEIVGVAADVRYRDLRTPPPRMVYVSGIPARSRRRDGVRHPHRRRSGEVGTIRQTRDPGRCPGDADDRRQDAGPPA